MASSYSDLREKIQSTHRHSSQRYYGKGGASHYGHFEAPRSRYDDQSPEEREEELKKIHSGITQRRLFSIEECKV